MQYYLLIRFVLREKSHLRKCLAKCRHCQILFFTHPRNAGRTDLGCPFGCRQVHRRNSARKRCIEYYKSDAGKIKKGYLNERRNEPVAEASPDETPMAETPADDTSRDKKPPDKTPVDCCKTGVDTSILHIQLVTSLIEERVVSLKEVIRMIDRLRQLSFDLSKKMLYSHCKSQTKPP